MVTDIHAAIIKPI